MQLSDVGAVAIADAVAGLPHVRGLDLRRNPAIGPRAVGGLMWLPTRSGLTSLRLPDWSVPASRRVGGVLPPSPLPPPRWSARAERRRTATSAREAQAAADDAADDAAAERAVAALAALHSTRLTELELPRWEALRTPRALLALAQSLRRGSRLAALDLRSSRATPDAVSALAHALGSPASQLVSLQLASNALPVASVLTLARTLHNNSRLRRLGLAHNNVGAAGARALLEAVRSPRCGLLELDLLGSGVGSRWQEALHRELATKRSVVRRQKRAAACAAAAGEYDRGRAMGRAGRDNERVERRRDVAWRRRPVGTSQNENEATQRR